MPPLSTEGFINKRDAAKVYKRSHRSLSRDITTAVKAQDLKTLQHFRLQTQDGEVREGIEVTIELLDRLRDEGQVPTWWAAREYLRERYGVRGEEQEQQESPAKPSEGEPRDTSSESHRSTPAPDASGKPALPADPETRAIVFEHLHYNDQQHAADMKAMMGRMLQLVETNQQLQAQTNTLFNQFQEALKGGGGLQGLLAGQPSAQPRGSTFRQVEATDVDGETDTIPSPAATTKRRQSGKHSKEATAKSRKSKKKDPAGKTVAPKPTSIWRRDVRDLFHLRSSRKQS